MTEHDDDLLISGAFRDFQYAAEPSVRPAGSSAVRGLAVQRRRTRITMLSVIGALVIAAPVATYAALDQDNQGPPTIGATPSPTPEETVVPSPTPNVSPSPTVTAAFTTAYFATSAFGQPVKIYSYTSEGQTKLLASIGVDDTGVVQATISVSPDATRLAWVDNNNDLYVANVNGSNKRKLLTGLDSNGQKAPVWTPDGQRLITNKGTVVVSTGTVSAPSLSGPYLRWSPDGQFYAYVTPSGAQGTVTVKRADGTKVSETPLRCDGCNSNVRSVLAISPDGRYVATGGWPTTGEREKSWHKVLDTQTGNDLPPNFEAPNSGRFLPDGTILLATGSQVKVMTIDGTVLHTYTLPSELTFSSRSTIGVQMLSVN
jgi:hypothetical protein